MMRKATGAGTHRGYGPASPPGVEVTARVEGALTQSREGLDRSPDQVVGQGLLYNQCSWEVRGCGRDWRIGPDSVEGRDNITLPEQRARGPRWSLLSEPEAGRYRVRAGGVRRRDISDEGHVKPGSARGYADLALKLGRFGGRAWLMATHLGLEPYWRKAAVRNLRGGAGDVAMRAGLRPAAKAAVKPPDATVGAPALYPTDLRSRLSRRVVRVSTEADSAAGGRPGG